ncbi:MAG: hydroxyisourate hydrolase [Nonomuraea sp.]|nr:hydroxyisourate hydrolase [Nonomuraea sp.]
MSFSTHVLNAATGLPQPGVAISLEKDGQVIAQGRTDADGRIKGWDPGEGIHRVVFRDLPSDFYPEVVIAFRVDDPAKHYHIPLLISPFAYSTYRGS